MQDATRFLTEHPYATLFVAVFAEQVGLPFPSILFLTAAGAMAALGHANAGLLLLSGISATLAADLLWYVVGRKRGPAVARFVSWISPSPDGLAQRAWRGFQKRGARILLWAKFVPSLSTFTTPLAGAVKMPVWRFLVFDGLGTVLWNGAFLGAGFALGPEIGRAAHVGAHIGAAPVVALFAALGAALAWRWLKTRENAAEPAPEAGHEPAFLRRTASGLAPARRARPSWLEPGYATQHARRSRAHGQRRLAYHEARRLVLR